LPSQNETKEIESFYSHYYDLTLNFTKNLENLTRVWHLEED